MKKLTLLLALGAMMALLPSVGKAIGIRGTHHDFGYRNSYWTYQKATNWVTNAREGGPGGSTNVCGACHAMHNSPDSTKGPLWIHKESAFADSYALYDQAGSETYDALGLTPPVLGASSKACMSCHDGTVGINETATYANKTTTTNLNYTDVTKTNAAGTAMGSIKLTSHVIARGAGDDLKHTHPVGISYVEARNAVAALNSDVIEINTPDTQFPGTNLKVKAQLKGSSQDRLECTTCHDIHATRGDAPLNDKLTVASGHNLCLGCHNK